MRRIWASGPRPEYRRQTQRFNLPNRCIPLVRKGLDVIILPGGHDGTRDFAAFCQDVLELGDEQVRAGAAPNAQLLSYSLSLTAVRCACACRSSSRAVAPTTWMTTSTTWC